MKQHLVCQCLIYFLIALSVCVYAQSKKKAILFRISEDNDFLNIRGNGTDKAYSNGTRFDLFYTPTKKRPFVLSGIPESKKDSFIYVLGWGIMQTIFTPADINSPYFQPKDYCYSGALFINHSFFVYNPIRHYSFQTELQLGIRGPAALGKETQTFIHRMINYTTPQGWDNQLQNAPVMNANFIIEKQVVNLNRYFEVIAGGRIYLGTLRNGITISPQIRWGLMNPYFSGYMSQFSSPASNGSQRKNNLQVYFVIKPELQFVFSNALLEDGLFGKTTTSKADSRRLDILTGINSSTHGDIRTMVYAINYGVVLSSSKFAVSFIQNTSSEMRKGTYSHEVGNISLYFHL